MARNMICMGCRNGRKLVDGWMPFDRLACAHPLRDANSCFIGGKSSNPIDQCDDYEEGHAIVAAVDKGAHDRLTKLRKSILNPGEDYRRAVIEEVMRLHAQSG